MSKALSGGNAANPMKQVGEILKFSTCVKKCPKATRGEIVECREPKFMFNSKGVQLPSYKGCVY